MMVSNEASRTCQSAFEHMTILFMLVDDSEAARANVQAMSLAYLVGIADRHSSYRNTNWLSGSSGCCSSCCTVCSCLCCC